MVRFITAWLVTTLLATALWGWAGRPVELPDVPGARFQCLSYTPFRDSQSPFVPNFVTPRWQIEEDLALLAPITGCVRTYSARQGLDAVVEEAAKHGMKVLLGTWIGADPKSNAREIAATLQAARGHPDAVRAIIVGNEVLLRKERTGEQLAEIIDSVRRQTDLPITYADVWEFWLKNPQVAQHVDFITIHILPYWEDLPVSVEGALAHVHEILAEVRATFPGKPVVIGETGWPSAGRTREGAMPGRVAQARFVREFIRLTGEEKIDYNLIEAFDQPWKRELEGTVGGHWGLFGTDRVVKFPLTGPVRELPRWDEAAALGGTLALGLLLWGWRRAPLSARRALALALLGHGWGALLFLHGRYLEATAMGPLGWMVGALGLLAIAGAGASLATLAVPGRWAEVRPAGLEAVRRWLRRPRRGALDPALLLGLLQGLTAVAAAATALALAVDPRYRDFPISLFAAPALAFALRHHRAGAGHHGPMEGWLAGTMLLCAVVGVVVETPLRLQLNWEAMVWNGVVVVLALPWLGAWREEWRRLRSPAGAA